VAEPSGGSLLDEPEHGLALVSNGCPQFHCGGACAVEAPRLDGATADSEPGSNLLFVQEGGFRDGIDWWTWIAYARR
jgi:hypothetical protein